MSLNSVDLKKSALSLNIDLLKLIYWKDNKYKFRIIQSDNSSSSKYQQGKNQKSELGKIILNSSKHPLFIVDSDVRPDFFMNFWSYRRLHFNLSRDNCSHYDCELV